MIQLDKINKRFYDNKKVIEALQNVTIHVEKGDIYGIIGFSGAGKSTLLRMVNRLEKPDSGSVRVEGQDLMGLTGTQLHRLRRRIGMVFQQFNLLE
ncbi:MAG: ATP-binding cassette domain-containing protein, partial [Acetatifactor sp.]|nr:ATP-binding cassette domain-containing protein [Acetatifactor sp.]